MKITIDYGTLAPALIPAVAAVLVLVLDAALPRLGRVHWIIAALACLGAAGSVVPVLTRGTGTIARTLCLSSGSCMYAVDRVAIALQLTALVGAAVIALLSYPIAAPSDRAPVAAALLLASTSGAVGVVAARDIGSWLVMLELATVPSVALVALRARRGAADGALSLLLTSLVSFGIVAMGAALWFAATGSAMFDGNAVLDAAADPQAHRVLVLAVVFILAGLGFKLSLVPFHAWTPEALGGASVPIGGFLAVVSKVAALGALLAVMRGVTVLGHGVLVAIGIIAAVSMTLGNVMALRETSMLRFLGWSTIAQAGWVVLPLAAVSNTSVRSAGGYLVIYAVATLVVFAVITAIAHADGRGSATALTEYTGLLRRRPLMGAAFALGLLVLAGLPPGIVGLVAKVLALKPVAADRLWWLAAIAAVNAMLGVAVYLRVLLVLLAAPGGRAAGESVHPLHRIVVAVGLLALTVTSLGPQLLLWFATP